MKKILLLCLIIISASLALETEIEASLVAGQEELYKEAKKDIIYKVGKDGSSLLPITGNRFKAPIGVDIEAGASLSINGIIAMREIETLKFKMEEGQSEKIIPLEGIDKPTTFNTGCDLVDNTYIIGSSDGTTEEVEMVNGAITVPEIFGAYPIGIISAENVYGKMFGFISPLQTYNKTIDEITSVCTDVGDAVILGTALSLNTLLEGQKTRSSVLTERRIISVRGLIDGIKYIINTTGMESCIYNVENEVSSCNGDTFKYISSKSYVIELFRGEGTIKLVPAPKM